MIRSLALAAAVSILAIPVSAAAADSAFSEFQSVCWGTSDDYVAALKAATADGWKDGADVTAADEEGVSVTDKSALEKSGDNGGRMTLLITRGIRHISSGDLKVTTCKLSYDKADPTLNSAAQAWIGGAADGGDATLAVYYVAMTPGTPNHVGKAGMNAALSAGGLSILKFQQDSNAAILVDQSYSK
jgi:hypothetical protein